MTAIPASVQFSPPPQPALGRSVVMAVAAHGVLLAALAWGVSWQHQAPVVIAEAELWARVPQAAAPREIVPPAVSPRPEPPPAPAPAVATPRPPDISTQREAAARREQERAEQARRDREVRQREQTRAQADAERREQARQSQLREDQLRRLAGLAGASGAAGATGTAPQAAGPSATYAGRVVARVRPNIVFTEPVSGNPVAEVEVRATPDGTIVARRILKSSGVPGWDEAVLRALDRTAVLPRDTDGRVPSPMVIAFRPQG